jgi:hypothetical protein
LVVELDRQLRAEAEQLLDIPCLVERLVLGNRLTHPSERDPRALALERDRDDAGAGFELDLAELHRPREHVRGAEHRMAGERQLRRGREDANARMRVVLGREHEDGLGVVHLLRELLHQVVVDVATVGEDGQLVAGQRLVGEDVGNDVAERSHTGSLRRRFR